MEQKIFQTELNGANLILPESDLIKIIKKSFKKAQFDSGKLEQDFYSIFLNLVKQDIDPTGVSLFELLHCLGAMEWVHKIIKNEPYFMKSNIPADAYKIAAALHDSSRVFLKKSIEGNLDLENVLQAHYDMRGHDKVSAKIVRGYLGGKLENELVGQISILIKNHGNKKEAEKEIYDAIRIADAAQTVLPGEYGRVPLWELCTLQSEFLEKGSISLESLEKSRKKINPIREQPEYKGMDDKKLVDRAKQEVIDYKKVDLLKLYRNLMDNIRVSDKKDRDEMVFEREQNDLVYKIATNAAYNLIDKRL